MTVAMADCNLGPTWEQRSCSQVEAYRGQFGMFWGQYTYQVAPQTAQDGLLIQTESQKFCSSNLESD